MVVAIPQITVSWLYLYSMRVVSSLPFFHVVLNDRWTDTNSNWFANSAHNHYDYECTRLVHAPRSTTHIATTMDKARTDSWMLARCEFTLRSLIASEHTGLLHSRSTIGIASFFAIYDFCGWRVWWNNCAEMWWNCMNAKAIRITIRCCVCRRWPTR